MKIETEFSILRKRWDDDRESIVTVMEQCASAISVCYKEVFNIAAGSERFTGGQIDKILDECILTCVSIYNLENRKLRESKACDFIESVQDIVVHVCSKKYDEIRRKKR